MNINFKQPKYVLPLLILPFFCLFFYVWQSGPAKPADTGEPVRGLNPNVGNVSGNVRKKQLNDKLDAYRNTYKESTGTTAVAIIPGENTSNPGFHNEYTLDQRRIDSIQEIMRINSKFQIGFKQPERQVSSADSYVNAAVRSVRTGRSVVTAEPGQADPMEVFRQQMTIMDSVSKQNDPEWKETQRKKAVAERAAAESLNRIKLNVTKEILADSLFNTVKPNTKQPFISAVIDENVTGYAGSRIRLKLLEDIRAGNNLIRKDNYLYAQVTGFSEQRVSLTITAILNEGKVLPVKLTLYDMDGLPGLYVPRSAFREFTKDLGSTSIQGVSIDGGTGSGQFMMSSLNKIFQSTSSAIASAIRKNKVKFQYNSFVYLIDTDALQNQQKNY